MTSRTVKDIMVPLSEYVVVSEYETIKGALEALKTSQDKTPPHMFCHRAVLVKSESDEIVGKLGYLDFLDALDPKFEDLDELKTLAGSGITKKDLKKEMQGLGFWNVKLPLIKKIANELTVKQVMVKFEAHIEETSSVIEAMHRMVQLKAQSLLTTEDNHITGIIRLSDLIKEMTDLILMEK